MTTFDNIHRTRARRLGFDWVAFLDGKYSRQQSVSDVGRLSVCFVDCGGGQMILDLQGGVRLWRMFAGLEVLEIMIYDDTYRHQNEKGRTLIPIEIWRYYG